jgi:hypothetical protein
MEYFNSNHPAYSEIVDIGSPTPGLLNPLLTASARM